MNRVVYLIIASTTVMGLMFTGCPNGPLPNGPEPPPGRTLWACLTVMDEYFAGPEWYESEGIPFGVLTFPMESCDDIETLGTWQTSTITPLQIVGTEFYDVTGVNCTEVRDVIFHPTNGLGFPIQGTRYAGRCRLSVDIKFDDFGTDVRIVDVGWTNTITLPNWTNRAACNRPQDIAEWDRWIQAGQVHEDGHVAINNALTGMPDVRLAVIGVTLQVGPNRTDDQKRDAVRQYVAGTQAMQQVVAEHLAYDTRTQHGVTQGAALRCPP